MLQRQPISVADHGLMHTMNIAINSNIDLKQDWILATKKYAYLDSQ